MTYRLELDLPGHGVIAYERKTPGEYDWDLREARNYGDEMILANHQEAKAKYHSELGYYDADFDNATRVSVGGFDVGPEPKDDKDQPAWDAFNAAEKAAMLEAMAAVAPALAEHSITLPLTAEDYATSHYAYCLGCKCSPGLVYRRPILHNGEGNPLNISIDVKE